ncbi:DUF1501 domain-containing protein [Gemmata sp. JC673]|uniref:DUF1501 domain-containing protein n=1 Tax=Gemmata algarum TaxID=2975278 RepID=A0ABU5EQU5_9BACT|nr:DUF1501 domain-containing protein [Gemmata algarum]MDY3557718.1 DUF1501 domain-containing protein [Gemmata algarum]
MSSRHDSRLDRRHFLRAGAASIGVSLSGWLGRLAAEGAADPARKRACILLWMNGGPSQIDTFDPKPEHANGGPVKAIGTKAAGVRISEYLPKLAQRADKLAVVRSMVTKEADHNRGSYLMRTGRVPGGPLRYPTLGSFVGKELVRPDAELPAFVSVAPFRQLSPEAYGPGFLGPRYAPLVTAETATDPPADDISRVLRVQDLDRPVEVSAERAGARSAFRDGMDAEFLADHPDATGEAHRTAYRRAAALMRAAGGEAFNLTQEMDALRDKYGRNLFGQGCLLARRLVERGVPFVEVTLSSAPGVNNGIGWDTHDNNFDAVKKLCGVLDPAWAALMDDLQARGLLDTTTIVWMGEFGRTPRINSNTGRDHWASAWSTVLAGGGIKGGQTVGTTSADGMDVKDRPVSVPDLLATVCTALGLDPAKQNLSHIGRPIRLVESAGVPLKEVVS